MDFKLTSDQQELQKVARDFANKELVYLADDMEAVSYTHLTLPTICSV